MFDQDTDTGEIDARGQCQKQPDGHEQLNGQYQTLANVIPLPPLAPYTQPGRCQRGTITQTLSHARGVAQGQGRGGEGIVAGNPAADRRVVIKSNPRAGSGAVESISATGGLSLNEEEGPKMAPEIGTQGRARREPSIDFLVPWAK